MIETSPETPLFLRGATWLGADPEGEVAQTGDIRIANGVIHSVGALQPQPGDTILDAAQMLVLPGLFDAVTDTSLMFCAGCLDEKYPETALKNLAAARAALDPAEEAGRTTYAARALLASGTTEVVDVIRSGPALAARVAARRAALEVSGLRADLAVEISDMDSGDAALADLFAQTDVAVRLQVAIAMPGPDEETEAWARITGLGLEGKDLYLLQPMQAALQDTDGLLHAAAILSRYARAAGGRVIAPGLSLRNPAEAEVAAKSGLAVVLTPEAEAMLGRQGSDGRILSEAGVDVRLGSGTLSNGGATMQTIMRLATMLDRPAQQQVSAWLTNRMVLGFATRDRSGTPRHIAPGAVADLAIYDLNAPVWTPLNNLDDQIVSSETGGSVILTLVNGRIVWRRETTLAALAR